MKKKKHDVKNESVGEKHEEKEDAEKRDDK